MTLPHVPKTRALLGLSVVAAAMAMAGATSAAAAPTQGEGEIRAVGTAEVVPNSFVVVFKNSVGRDAVSAMAGKLTVRFGGTRGRMYQNAVRGFEVSMPEESAKRLAADPSVSYVQRNGIHKLLGTQAPTPSWGLDRIDQRALPLNNSYTYPSTASGVKAYIIDTGIRFSHTDFGGRAITGFDAIDGGPADDGNGHGTHVAGTVGGTTYGVAKGVTLVGVRVLNNAGSGTTAQVVAGIDWVTGDHQPGQRAVANMSLGGGVDPTLDNAVASSIADGVTYGVAAGNDFGANACDTSPARTPNAITVGATTITDARSDFSNIGSCLDIFAPGSSITSDWNSSDSATNTISGTSMATPHVVGAAALVLALNPGFTPQQVRDYLVNNATNGVITNVGTGSPNKLLFVVNTAPIPNDYALSAAPASGSVTRGSSITTSIHTTVTSGVSRPITLTAAGLPSGVTATFTPSSLNTGASSTLALSTAATTVVGTYPITITATGTNPTVTRSTTYTLTVTGAAGCSGTNPTNVPISDYTTVQSTITISGCPGNAGSGSQVTVNIVHTYIGDLVVSLVAPDGSVYTLHNRTGGGTDNLNATYTVNLSSEPANGIWRLRVTDAAAGDIGFLDAWGLNLQPSASPPCTGTNNTDVAIPDNTTVESPIVITGCAGNGSVTSTVEVHIVHTYIGDLVVSLVAPDGTAYVLHNRAGGSTDNINQTFPVNLSSEVRNGTWKLRVQDAATIDVGYINSWTLAL